MLRRNKGFTLIELLVVIAIIAILAAILFPVFAKAREKARQASCLSNLKQLGLGLMQYVQDYDETLPTYYWGEGNAGNPYSATWWGSAAPYVKNLGIYKCPSNGRMGHNTWGVWVTGNPANAAFNVPSFTNSYGYNEEIANVAGGTTQSMFKYPAEIVVLADCSSSWIGGYWSAPWPDRALLRRIAFASSGWGCGCGPPAINSLTWPWEDQALHNGGQNIAFADGHAKWFQARKTMTISAPGGTLRYYAFEW